MRRRSCGKSEEISQKSNLPISSPHTIGKLMNNSLDFDTDMINQHILKHYFCSKRCEKNIGLGLQITMPKLIINRTAAHTFVHI